MVLLSGVEQPKAAWEFEAEILILNHPTTISQNYEAMIHVGAVRQTAKILHMNKDVLRTGDRDRILFRFTRRPEYIVPGTRLVFREGLTKAVGTIEKICVHAVPLSVPKGPAGWFVVERTENSNVHSRHEERQAARKNKDHQARRREETVILLLSV